jgi:heavy metal sensor kinase
MLRTRSSPFASVRVRLTLWNVGVVALILVALGLTLRYMLQAALTDSVDRGMAWAAGGFERGVSSASSVDAGIPRRWRGRSDRADDQRTNTDPLAGRLWPRILDLNGQPILDRFPDGMIYKKGLASAARGQTDYRTILVDKYRVRVLSFPLTQNGKVVAVLQLGHEMQDDVDRPVNALTRVLLTLIPLGILVAGLGGLFLTVRAMQPVRQMTRAASKIEAQNLSERLDVGGHDEFSTLAETFNGMLDRLEQAFRRLEQMYEQQRQFTGDASHELRTPLTIIKANASLALARPRTKDEYLQAIKIIDQAADRTNRILADLLMLARADAGQLDVPMETVVVGGILEDTAALFRSVEGPSILLEPVDAGLYVRGNAGMLARVFENLLSNAARHTPATGEIRVHADQAADSVMIVVADTGEGIDADHLPRLTERFYRADPARSRAQGGSGLGLAICQSIVDAHRGTLRIDSVVGVGTSVTITLPRIEPTKAKLRPAGQPQPASPEEHASRQEAA